MLVGDYNCSSCNAHPVAVPLRQAFDPPSVTIKAGESVTWVNNAGFPHNVVFDEDDVPVRLAQDLIPFSARRDDHHHVGRGPVTRVTCEQMLAIA